MTKICALVLSNCWHYQAIAACATSTLSSF